MALVAAWYSGAGNFFLQVGGSFLKFAVLRELLVRKDGYIHLRGATKAARWYPGREASPS